MEDIGMKNAKEIGLDATIESLKELLVQRFQVAPEASHIKTDDPLFSVGVGLSSIEGLELLTEIEKKYGVVIKDLDYWVDESPTLDGVARYLIENSPPKETPST
jgi:acyl carrier protein